MTDLNDKIVAERTLEFANRLATALALDNDFSHVSDPQPSGNLECAWIIDAGTYDGRGINIEIAGNPWEDDGTWPAEPS